MRLNGPKQGTTIEIAAHKVKPDEMFYYDELPYKCLVQPEPARRRPGYVKIVTRRYGLRVTLFLKRDEPILVEPLSPCCQDAHF